MPATGENQISVKNYYQTPLNRQPDNINPLMNTYFRFIMNKVPTITYFCQRVNLPSLSFDSVEQPTRFGARLYKAGDAYSYEDLNIDFIVDENMKNWNELYEWLRSCANLEDTSEYENPEIHTTDAELIIVNSAKRPIKSISFKNVLPTSLGSLQFDSTTTETEPIICNATFRYTSYSVTSI